jgi:hypothetical protein
MTGLKPNGNVIFAWLLMRFWRYRLIVTLPGGQSSSAGVPESRLGGQLVCA